MVLARIISLAFIGVALAACASVASPTISPTVVLTPTATTVPLSRPTASVVSEPESAIIEFVENLDPDQLAEIPPWLTIPAGDFELNFRMVALPPSTEGQWPIVLATCYLYSPGVSHWIFWWREGRWENQRLEGFILDDTVIDARQEISERGRELGLVYDHNSGGSAPFVMYSLWRWDEDAWVKIWQPSSLPGEWRAIHGRIDFPGPGLDVLVVTSSSWGLEEEKSQIFHESNPGPHRWFQDTWVRKGDSYRLAESRTVPSAYNTLVEFIYNLRHGDDERLLALVIDPVLVAKARDLRLNQLPSGTLILDFGPSLEQAGPLAFDWEGQTVSFSFVQQGEDWLISAIEIL